MKTRRRPSHLLLYLFTVAALYVGLTAVVFALRHPELTGTQCALRFWDWLTWGHAKEHAA